MTYTNEEAAEEAASFVSVATQNIEHNNHHQHFDAHSEMQVHPDSCRASIYAEATGAEWDIMSSGYQQRLDPSLCRAVMPTRLSDFPEYEDLMRLVNSAAQN